MDIICAFSSDSRELYKADIYRVLALPVGHIVHFRYKKKYVDDNILQSHEQLKHEKVAIFFTHGNDLSAQDKSFQHFSIRWATIAHTEISNETDVFHVYMKLGNFCNVSIESGNSQEKQPGEKFFSKLRCTEHTHESNWQHRVRKVTGLFPDITFFHLKGIYDGNKSLSLKYQDSEKSCHYNLVHGNRYILKMSLGNPSASTTKIELSDSSEEITINSINPIETSVEFDDYDISISVKTLQVMKQASLLKFKPFKENGDLGEYATNIELNLNLSLKRPAVFGLFSTLAFWALLLAKPMSTSAVWPSCWTLFWATLLFYLASSSLFFWFNKK